MKNMLLILIVLCTGPGFSQQVDRIPAKEAGLKNYPSLYGCFNKGKAGIFHKEISDKGKQKVFTLDKYNSDLGTVFSYSFTLEEKEEFQFMEVKQEKIFLFTTLYDGRDKSLYLRVLDGTAGKETAGRKQLASLASDPFGVSGRNFPILFSPDESKMMVVSAFQWAKKPQVVKADVYDLSSMKLINTVDLPDSYNNVMIKSSYYNVTDQGNILYMIRTDVKDKDVPLSETLVLYDAGSKTNKYLALPLAKKKIENSYNFISGDVLFLTGVFKDNYPKKDDKDNKAGVFCITASLKDFKLSSEFNYFSPETEEKLSYKDGAKKRELAEKEFSSREPVRTATGFYLVENLTYTVEMQGSNYTVYKSYSREFIVTKFNTSGKMEFMRIIPKNTTNKMYDADLIESNDNLYLFYCEHPKNLEKYTLENFDPKEYNDVGDLRGPVAVCVKIDPKGNLSRQELLTNETWCYWPGSGVVLKEGKELVVMEIQKDEYILDVFRIRK
ncbi:MAG: hypothetical protein JWO44_1160 [Bacteroidetes bacterium]|nr:hypothetical protein [Bacteroidota bacterium]